MSQPPELIDWILSEVRSGESQAAIAQALNVGASTLCGWLASDEIHEGHELSVAERSAQARRDSAEAWLDKGLQAVRDAMSDPAYKGTGTDSGAARAYAQECARRAAIRNPAYREQRDAKVELSAPGGGPVRVVALQSSMTPEQAAIAYKDLIG